MKILAFIQALLPSIQKDKVLEDLRVTISELDQVVAGNYQAASDYFRTTKFQSDDNKSLSEVFYRNFDLQHASKQSSFVGEISRRLDYLKENAVYIQELLEEVLERDVINEGLTAKKAMLIRSAETLSFISRFSIDVLNVVYANEAKANHVENEDDVGVAPAVVKHVEQNIAKLASAVSNYGIPNKEFSKIVLNIPDVVVNSKTGQSLSSIYKESDIDPFSSGYVVGFTYNPIYHIRLVVAEWQASRYKANKDKKKMLELRLLHLKLLQEKKNDPKVQQEINYIQSRVDKIERYLREIEESLGDEG